MTRTTREDMVVINMGIDALLECVRHTEAWWRSRGDSAALRRTQQLGNAILTTRRKFFVHALEKFVKKAKTVTPLNPAAKPLVASLAEIAEKNSKWKLLINEPVEIDS